MNILYLVSGVGPRAGWGTECIQDLIFSLAHKNNLCWIINPIYGHTSPEWKDWVKQAEKDGNIKIISLPAPSWINKHFILHLALTPFIVTIQLIKLCLKVKFDVIHEFSSTPIILSRHLFIKMFFRIRTIFTLSVYNNTLLGDFFWFKIFNFANYYLIPSKEIAEQLKHTGIKKEKIIFSPPGINLAPFAKVINKDYARKSLNLPLNKYLLSYFGSLTKEKGVEDLLQASLLIERKYVTRLAIVFYVIWKGSPRHRYFIKRIQKGDFPLVKLVEKYVDIPTLLAASDAVVLPQQTGHGTTIPPISTLEVIAAGKPLITTNILGNRDFSNFQNVKLIPPKSPVTLAAAIISLMYKRPTQVTNNNVLENYDLSRSTELHLSIYQTLLKQKLF